MSDETQTQETQESKSRLDSLKERADQMGISYHPSIGADKLSKKIEEALDGKSTESEAPAEAPKAESENDRRRRVRDKASQLVRVQLTCMNPNKSEWEGEMFSAGNSITGTYKRYVPFNVEWHVPRIILNMIQERQVQIFQTRRDERGNQVREGKLIKEFNVAELPPLSEAELKDLAQRQAMANGTQ